MDAPLYLSACAIRDLCIISHTNVPFKLEQLPFQKFAVSSKLLHQQEVSMTSGLIYTSFTRFSVMIRLLFRRYERFYDIPWYPRRVTVCSIHPEGLCQGTLFTSSLLDKSISVKFTSLSQESV